MGIRGIRISRRYGLVSARSTEFSLDSVRSGKQGSIKPGNAPCIECLDHIRYSCQPARWDLCPTTAFNFVSWAGKERMYPCVSPRIALALEAAPRPIPGSIE